MKNNIAGRILELQNALGLTLKELSEASGVSFGTLKGMKENQSNPNADNLLLFVKAWPEYGFWIVTGSSEATKQLDPKDIQDTKVREAIKLLETSGYSVAETST
jgi:transcriptional regulator with XRE-family HTH domain